jgi:hypothetical protein
MKKVNKHNIFVGKTVYHESRPDKKLTVIAYEKSKDFDKPFWVITNKTIYNDTKPKNLSLIMYLQREEKLSDKEFIYNKYQDMSWRDLKLYGEFTSDQLVCEESDTTYKYGSYGGYGSSYSSRDYKKDENKSTKHTDSSKDHRKYCESYSWPVKENEPTKKGDVPDEDYALHDMEVSHREIENKKADPVEEEISASEVGESEIDELEDDEEEYIESKEYDPLLDSEYDEGSDLDVIDDDSEDGEDEEYYDPPTMQEVIYEVLVAAKNAMINTDDVDVLRKNVREVARHFEWNTDTELAILRSVADLDAQ